MTLATDRQQSIREALDKIPELEYAEPKAKHWIDYSLLKAFSFLFKISPRGFNRFITRRLSDLIRMLLKKRNEGILQNMMEVLQIERDEAKQLLKKSYYQFVDNLVNLVNNERLNEKELRMHYDTSTLEKFRDAEKLGRGVIVATMHMGNWESVPRVMALEKYPSGFVAAVQHNPLCDRFFNSMRSQKGYHKIIHNRLGIRHVLGLLKAGGRLVVIADVDVGGKGVFVPFLGKTASTPRGPAELALRTGALIIVGLTVKKEDGKIHMILGDEIDPLKIEGDRESAVKTISTEINASLSKVIRQYPEQWFWLQRRWKSKATE